MRRVLLAALILALAMPAIAQTPAAEISGGWSFLAESFLVEPFLFEPFLVDTERGFNHYPLGFQIGGAWRLTDSLALVGDFGWNRSTLRLPQFKSQRTRTTFSAGPRLYFGERVTGFVHALVGVIRVKAAVSEPNPELVVNPYDTSFGDTSYYFVGPPSAERLESAFMIQPGGGVDIRVSGAFAVRLQGDYQWVNAEDTDGNLRFVAAAVFYLGER